MWRDLLETMYGLDETESMKLVAIVIAVVAGIVVAVGVVGTLCLNL